MTAGGVVCVTVQASSVVVAVPVQYPPSFPITSADQLTSKEYVDGAVKDFVYVCSPQLIVDSGTI